MERGKEFVLPKEETEPGFEGGELRGCQGWKREGEG